MNNLAAMRNDAYAFASFDIALSFQCVQQSLQILIKASRIDQIAIQIRSSNNAIYTWNTLPGEWINRYHRHSYALCDPISRAGFSKAKPFFLSDLKIKDNERRFLEDAVRHGIGPRAYCIPQANDNGRAIIVVFSQSMKVSDWRYYINSVKSELLHFSQSIHLRAIDELNLQ